MIDPNATFASVVAYLARQLDEDFITSNGTTLLGETVASFLHNHSAQSPLPALPVGVTNTDVIEALKFLTEESAPPLDPPPLDLSRLQLAARLHGLPDDAARITLVCSLICANIRIYLLPEPPRAEVPKAERLARRAAGDRARNKAERAARMKLRPEMVVPVMVEPAQVEPVQTVSSPAPPTTKRRAPKKARRRRPRRRPRAQREINPDTVRTDADGYFLLSPPMPSDREMDHAMDHALDDDYDGPIRCAMCKTEMIMSSLIARIACEGTCGTCRSYIDGETDYIVVEPENFFKYKRLRLHRKPEKSPATLRAHDDGDDDDVPAPASTASLPQQQQQRALRCPPLTPASNYDAH